MRKVYTQLENMLILLALSSLLGFWTFKPSRFSVKGKVFFSFETLVIEIEVNAVEIVLMLMYTKKIELTESSLHKSSSFNFTFFTPIFLFPVSQVPKCALQGALNLFNPSVTNAAIYMAADELQDVIHLDKETIQDHLPKLLFYYGTHDGWCPVDYYRDIKGLFPSGDIRLCQQGIEHAFVLESSEPMADLVWDWMEKDITALQ